MTQWLFSFFFAIVLDISGTADSFPGDTKNLGIQGIGLLMQDVSILLLELAHNNIPIESILLFTDSPSSVHEERTAV